MRSLPKPQLAASPSLRHLQHHLRRLLSISRGITPGKNQLNLLNQPPLPRGLLNQPPLPQSLPSQPLHLSQPRLPRVDPPRAPQPMRIRGWAHLCDALRGSRQPAKPLLSFSAHHQHGPDIPLLLVLRYLLGRSHRPFSFSSVYIEDLSSGRRMYIKHVQQIVDLLPRTLDPSSRYTLRAHVKPPGHQKTRDSLRLALWCFLPRDGDFRRAANGLHYHLARQGRRVILRGG